MSKKTLLLDSSYQVLSFISERRLFKLLFKEKVEIESSWNDEISWINGKIKYPSIVRLKKYIKRTYFNSNFSRRSIIKRDESKCQYCDKKLSASQITIDHILPKARGGITSFVNCVVSCHSCNNKKADRTPEQADMTLLKRPMHPSFLIQHYVPESQEYWHADWDNYFTITL